MAKFRDDNLDLETGEHIDFDDADTIQMGYDGNELYINSTVSGVRAALPHQMVRYDQLTETSGILSDHGNLSGLLDDDHLQYILTDGTRELTGDWVTGSGIEVPWIQFDITPSGVIHVEGKLHWNEDDGTLEIDMPGGEVRLQIGQETLLKVKNDTGLNIDNGDAVYVSGGSGNLPSVSLADADSLATSGVIGIATEDINSNATGFVTTFGLVRGIDTSSWPAGTLLWLSTTAGELTSTRPTAPKTGVVVAISIRQHATDGIILVKTQTVDRLMGLSDVLSDTPADGEYLIWNATNSRFELTSSSGGGIDHGSLLGLDDDDHIMYVPTDGLRGFTSTVSGVAATQPEHLVIYEQLINVSGSLQDQIDDLDTSSSGIETFLDLTDTPITYSGQAGYHTVVNSSEDGLSFTYSTIVSGTLPPASGTSGLWYNNDDNIVYYWDDVRLAWLSTSIINYLFTYSGNIDGLYLSVGNVVDSYAHYNMSRPATVISVSADQGSGSSQPDKGYEIHSNGVSIFSFNMILNTYTSTTLNEELDHLDELQTYCVAAGARARDPIITLEVRWRYET